MNTRIHKRWHRWMIGMGILMLLLTVQTVSAQDSAFEPPRESGDAYVLHVDTGGELSLGAVPDFPLPTGTVDVDYNPQDPSRWLRADNFGIIRFVPEGAPGEGVYTFKPFFEGFEVGAPAENKYFVRQVAWSPDGDQFAFFSRNRARPDLDQGLWFWQPRQELATDPAYPLLRPCPSYCSQAGLPASAAGWRFESMEWSSDNESLLVSVTLLEDDRRALTVRRAERDPQLTQATTAPMFLGYEYGHWAADGNRIVVSGQATEIGDTPQQVVGIISRNGTPVTELTPVGDLGLTRVRDAVETPAGELLMLGYSDGDTRQWRIINGDGDALTPPIAAGDPLRVVWSPNKQAALLDYADATYVALVNGTVYDLTVDTNSSPLVDWVGSSLPGAYTSLPLPPPAATAEDIVPVTPPATPVDTAVPPPVAEFVVGDLLQLTSGTLTIYDEPVNDASQVGTLEAGEELIITGGPLAANEIIWYRVQTLDYSGWVRSVEGLTRP